MTVPATTNYINGPVDDQLEMYDKALLDWLTSDFVPIIPGKTAQALIATPHRAYMEVETQDMILDQTRLHVPRLALTRMNYARDAARFNPIIIRALGRATTPGLYKLKQEQYPVPINIPYQIDFWTEFARDMNLWAQRFLYEFAFSYKYLQVHVDSMWGDKQFFLVLEGDLQDTSDLEPQEGYREIRRTATVTAQCWLFGQHPAATAVVKRTLVEVTETDGGPVVETFSPNRRQDLYTTPGGQTIFSGAILDPLPALKDTFVLSARFGGVERVAQDDGLGVLFGPNVASGSVNYVTGAVDITYNVAPDAGVLQASWLTDQS